MYSVNGGEGEIRTHGGGNPTPVFKTGALNHSTTSPIELFQKKHQLKETILGVP